MFSEYFLKFSYSLQLEDLQNQEVVQFRAQMVFGDDDDLVLSPTELPSTSTITSALADALVDAQGAMQTMEIMKKADTEVPKKKKSRRKSLIVGAASPLKCQSIEKPRFEDVEEEVRKSITGVFQSIYHLLIINLSVEHFSRSSLRSELSLYLGLATNFLFCLFLN